MLRRYRTLILSICIAVLLFSYIIGEIRFDTFDGSWLREVKSGPQYIMQNTITTQYDEQGMQRYKMTAAQLSQPSDSTHIELVKPKISLQKEPAQYWQVSADYGQLIANDENQQQFLLQQQVSISSQQAGVEDFDLSTSELVIFPDRKLALTSTQVTIRSQGIETNATGLNLDFDAGIVKLESKIQTIIQPATQKKSEPNHSN